MKWLIQDTEPTQVKTDLVVIFAEQNTWETNPHFQKWNTFLQNLVFETLKKEKFKAKEMESRTFTMAGKPALNLLVLGIGEKKGDDQLQILRRLAAKSVKLAQGLKATHITFVLPELANVAAHDISYSLAEGAKLATYGFYRYKKKPEESVEIETALIVTPQALAASVETGVKKAELTTEGVFLARDLINTPACDMTPIELGKVASKIKGVSVKVHSLAEIQKLKMGSFLGVALGSTQNPPVLIEMHYAPKNAKKKILLIGKGVTFDSGGLSLKPPKSMETMKDDMSAAASVIALMSLMERLSPNVEVWALVAATENMPDGHALRPGDVITSMKGKTIEVLNTDAEGRLTLADAIEFGLEKKPDLIIDMATLTGACLVALGQLYAGLLGNDQKLADELMACGNKVGEKMWPLPLAEEYKEELKSPIADLKNVGGSYGGTITAALFLQEFVGKTPWAHIDIAGPSWTEKPREYETVGGTGFMVRTLVEFLGKF